MHAIYRVSSERPHKNIKKTYEKGVRTADAVKRMFNQKFFTRGTEVRRYSANVSFDSNGKEIHRYVLDRMKFSFLAAAGFDVHWLAISNLHHGFS